MDHSPFKYHTMIIIDSQLSNLLVTPMEKLQI